MNKRFKYALNPSILDQSYLNSTISSSMPKSQQLNKDFLKRNPFHRFDWWKYLESFLLLCVMTYIILHDSVPTIFAISSLKDPRFQTIEPEIVEI